MMKNFADITRDFLEEKNIEETSIRCAYVRVAEIQNSDVGIECSNHKYFILKEDYCLDDLDDFWEELNFNLFGKLVIITARIWIDDRRFAYFDCANGCKWKCVYIPEIPENCKRSRK